MEETENAIETTPMSYRTPFLTLDEVVEIIRQFGEIPEESRERLIQAINSSRESAIRFDFPQLFELIEQDEDLDNDMQESLIEEIEHQRRKINLSVEQYTRHLYNALKLAHTFTGIDLQIKDTLIAELQEKSYHMSQPGFDHLAQRVSDLISLDSVKKNTDLYKLASEIRQLLIVDLRRFKKERASIGGLLSQARRFERLIERKIEAYKRKKRNALPFRI